MNSIISNSLKIAAQDLLRQHFAVVQLPKEVLEISDRILAEGLTFFNLPYDRKIEFQSDNVLNDGYLVKGLEIDQITGRPDLSEKFQVWSRSESDPKIQEWSKKCEFYKVMQSGLNAHINYADEIFRALHTEIGSVLQIEETNLNIHGETYLQMNFARPSSEIRDTISDTHEDGHLFTIIRPTGPGLMVCEGSLVESPSREYPKGKFILNGNLRHIETKKDEAVLVPSSPTFYLTGGLLKPLFHAVAVTDQPIRQSLMLFVNPEKGIPLKPWVRNSINTDIDDVRTIIDNIDNAHIDRHQFDM